MATTFNEHGRHEWDAIVVGDLPKGITLAGQPQLKREWHVLGHTYHMKANSESSFAFETYDPPGTGVPPHIHPTQDEHIYVVEGVFTLYLDGAWETAGPGDTVRMPKGLPHAYYNRGDVPTRGLFWVSPARRLAELFDKLHEITDPEEVVRLSAECEVDFLPAGTIDGA